MIRCSARGLEQPWKILAVFFANRVRHSPYRRRGASTMQNLVLQSFTLRSVFAFMFLEALRRRTSLELARTISAHHVIDANFLHTKNYKSVSTPADENEQLRMGLWSTKWYSFIRLMTSPVPYCSQYIQFIIAPLPNIRAPLRRNCTTRHTLTLICDGTCSTGYGLYIQEDCYNLLSWPKEALPWSLLLPAYKIAELNIICPVSSNVPTIWT